MIVLGFILGALFVRIAWHKRFTGQRIHVVYKVRVDSDQAIKDLKEMEVEINRFKKEMNLL